LTEIIDDNVSVDDGITYKFRSPGVSDHAGYFTVIGVPDPIAFMLNSKEMESFQWITGLMTSWSRQLEDGAPISRIIADMKETFQPGGDYIIPDGSGRKVHSVVHHLGLILERHMIEVKKIYAQKLQEGEKDGTRNH